MCTLAAKALGIIRSKKAGITIFPIYTIYIIYTHLPHLTLKIEAIVFSIYYNLGQSNHIYNHLLASMGEWPIYPHQSPSRVIYHNLKHQSP